MKNFTVFLQQNAITLIMIILFIIVLFTRDFSCSFALYDHSRFVPAVEETVELVEPKINKSPKIEKDSSYLVAEAYIKRFKKVAYAETEKYGIPVEIKFAQGLLESNKGNSFLAVKLNNHFGIKCFSKSCKKGHCSNFPDDTHKDYFRVYENAWQSWRAHSELLATSKYYKSLFKINKSDYKAWAKGLKKAGYATDEKYAEKLIAVIETYVNPILKEING